PFASAPRRISGRSISRVSGSERRTCASASAGCGLASVPGRAALGGNGRIAFNLLHIRLRDARGAHAVAPPVLQRLSAARSYRSGAPGRAAGARRDEGCGNSCAKADRQGGAIGIAIIGRELPTLFFPFHGQRGTDLDLGSFSKPSV